MNSENIILQGLKTWVNNNKSNKNRYSNTIIGKFIKDLLIKENHWKCLPRGDAKKGYEVNEKKKNNKK